MEIFQTLKQFPPATIDRMSSKAIDQIQCDLAVIAIYLAKINREVF
jgi:hypothetical protein